MPLFDPTTWIIRILWSHTLILETRSTHSLHDVQQSSSHMVTPTRAALSLSLTSSAVVSHYLLHKWNNSLADIRPVDLCYLVKHLPPHFADRLWVSAESRVSPQRKTSLAHSALVVNKAQADLEVPRCFGICYLFFYCNVAPETPPLLKSQTDLVINST